jgi:N-acetylglucosaminyldiphosphoundecaprenol N-acetyl-beta-D-mannosaminyltransferase
MSDLPESVDVLGHRVHPVDLGAAAQWTLQRARAPARSATALVVTLNPEIVVRSRRDAALAAALAGAELTVADGVGVVWAARRGGSSLPGRVPGVDLVERVLEGGGSDLRVFFLGGRPGVCERAADEAAARWGIVVAGARHGFFDRADEGASIAEEIARSRPHLLLAGLGEGQEVFLHVHRDAFGAGVAIGVGGTLDVLAGVATRTPSWTRRVGLEWAWRVGLDPARWHRIPRLVEFALLTLRASRGARRRPAGP